MRQRAEGGIFQVRLEGEEQDDEHVLQNQNAQRDAAGERFDLAFVVKDFDDDDRAAHGRGDTEVKRLQPVFRRADQIEHQPAEQDAAEDLRGGGQGDDPARAQHFFQVNLQPDHEQQQRQADFGDGLDVLGVGDPLETVRADDEPGDEIGEQHRLAQNLGQHRQNPGGDDADGDVVDESLLHAGAKLNEQGRCRRAAVWPFAKNSNATLTSSESARGLAPVLRSSTAEGGHSKTLARYREDGRNVRQVLECGSPLPLCLPWPTFDSASAL